MGRVISGISGSSGDAVGLTNIFSLTAGEDIAMGNLALAAEDGYAYKANPLLSLAQLNNNTAGAVAVAANVALEANANYRLSLNTLRNIITFPTGEVITAYVGNGTTATTGVRLSIRNITTGVALPTISVSSDTSVGNGAGVEKLTSSTFAVWWFEGTALKFAVYNKDGTLVTATTAGPSVGSTGRGYALCRGLINGDFVFLYRATDNSTRFTRYSSLGVIQGAEVTVEAGTQNPDKPNIIALAAGGFVCQWWNSTSSAWRFARYNSSGVIQGAIVSAPNSSNVLGTYSNWDQIGIELDGAGKIAVVRRSNEVNSPWYVDIYSSANALLLSINIQHSGFNPDAVPIIIKTKAGGFITISGGGIFRKFDGNGGQIGAEVNLSTIGASTYSNGASYSSIWVEEVPSGFAVLRQEDDLSNRALTFSVVSPDFAIRGSRITLRASGTGAVNGPCMALLNSVAIIGYQDTAGASPVISSYLTSRTSIFGVAQASVSKDSAAQLNTRGSFELTDSYPSGGSFDVRTNTAPGNRGTVAGSSALLLGTSV